MKEHLFCEIAPPDLAPQKDRRTETKSLRNFIVYNGLTSEISAGFFCSCQMDDNLRST